MLGLTDEQMIEIGRARERLETIKNKAQPYPAYPEEREPMPLLEQPPEPGWTQEQWRYVQQLRAQVNYLNAKVTEMRAEKKKMDYY